MELASFHALAADEAAALASSWADVPWWVAAVVRDRPYADVDALAATASGLALRWTADDVAQALAAHPRIGERPVGAGESAAASRREQSGAADSDAATLLAIRRGNQAYEHRFGRVFLIRAAGRSGPEILAELTRRLELDPDAEAVETADQLREIALLRLRSAVVDPVASRPPSQAASVTT